MCRAPIAKERNDGAARQFVRYRRRTRPIDFRETPWILALGPAFQISASHYQDKLSVSLRVYIKRRMHLSAYRKKNALLYVRFPGALVALDMGLGG